MYRRFAAVATTIVVGLIGALGTAPSDAATASTTTVDDGLYVVALRGDPLASYAGELLIEQQAVIESLGSPEVLYHYTTALNGFAARLTTAQVKQLGARPDVLAVQASSTAHLDQVDLSGGAGLTAQPQQVAAQAGDGVVIGIIDSGIWPENPSFAGLPLDSRAQQRAYPGFTGSCDVGERWTAATCNAKIIAAHSFVAGFGESNLSSAEFVSARDGSGHGSHTAAIAAGNSDVAVTIDGQQFGSISGQAPGAALAVYKACWAAPDPADDGCDTADTVAAIDRAVNDGVDVINYSASRATDRPDDVVELAFLNAAAAGVFVSTSAGDDGPAAGSVSHASPWVATVAASTRAGFVGAVRLGDGTEIVGSMVSDQPVASAPLVAAREAAAPGSKRAEAALCLPGSLDASVADSAIVVCDRGEIARVSKSASVEQAGGVAMVLVNTTPGSTDADVHAVPTVQVALSAGRTIKRYLANAEHPTASLDPTASDASTVPRLADFSARGPVGRADGDHLKPDLAAPGVSIVSAVAPPSNFGRLWDIYSGTSMAAPRVAGLAAVLQAAHPRWSPAAVKSAMMTTATRLAGSAGPLRRGAGEIDPSRALDPGLVYDAGVDDWRRYLRAAGVETRVSTFPAGEVAESSSLNEPSIALGRLVGQAEVVRQVTNVGNRTETYTGKVTGLPGIASQVTPSTLRLAPGRSAKFTVSFTAQRTADYGRFASGELRWSGSLGHTVTSPVVIRPELVEPPPEILGEDSDGTSGISATAGVTGTIKANLIGPVAAQPSTVELTRGPFDSRGDTDTDTGNVSRRTFAVADGTAAIRFEVSDASGDVDLYAYRDGHLAAASNSISADEQITLTEPAGGTYDVYVVAAGEPSDETVTATFTGWVLPAQRSDSMDVTPNRSKVTGASDLDLEVSWSDLADSQRWLGMVRYAGSSQVTYVTVN